MFKTLSYIGNERFMYIYIMFMNVWNPVIWVLNHVMTMLFYSSKNIRSCNKAVITYWFAHLGCLWYWEARLNVISVAVEAKGILNWRVTKRQNLSDVCGYALGINDFALEMLHGETAEQSFVILAKSFGNHGIILPTGFFFFGVISRLVKYVIRLHGRQLWVQSTPLTSISEAGHWRHPHILY